MVMLSPGSKVGLNDVKDYDALGDGSTDDTAAIQAAMNDGSNVYLPPGNYVISSTLTTLSSAFRLFGAGRRLTTLSPNFTTGDIIAIGDGTVNPSEVEISGLSIITSAVRTTGAAVHVQNGHNVCLNDIEIAGTSHNVGVQFDGGASQFIYKMQDFEVGTCTAQGILIGGGTAGLVQGVTLTNGELASCAEGLYIANVSGLYVQSVDMISCTTAGVYFFPNSASSQTVDAVFFDQVSADTCTGGPGFALFGTGAITDVQIVNCWAATNHTHGIHISNTNTNGVLISASRSMNNQQHGIYLAAGTKISIQGCQIFCNSQAGSALNHGIDVVAGLAGFRIADCDIGDGGKIHFIGSNLQGYGINLEAGSTGGFVISGNQLGGNVTGGMLNGATNVNQRISRNVGYASESVGTASITTGNTTVVVNHGLPQTPSAGGITITPTSGLGSASTFWISTITSTQFTIHLNVNPGGTVTFGWVARITDT